MLATDKFFNPGTLRPEQLARLAPSVTLLLVLILAFQAARLSWQLFPKPALPTPDPTFSAPVPEQLANLDVQAIAGWHLFGEVAAEGPAPAPVVQAPETRLNLKLAGILHSDTREQARAIIGQSGAPEQVYGVGDSIATGVELAAIERDRVILSRGGRLESLSLPADDDGATPSRSTNLPTSLPGSINAEDESAVNAGEIAAKIRDQLEEDPGAALAQVALANPYVQNGQFVGFRLRPGRDRRMLGQLGLRSGDVITEVNGTRLSSPAEGLVLMQGLMNADQISVKVLRNNEEIPFTFYLNQ